MIPSSRLIFSALFLVGTALAHGAAAQSIVTGDLDGRVTDPTGRPIAGALVTIKTREAGGRAQPTDSDGRFALSFVLPGTYQVQAEALGWRPVLVDLVRIEAGRTATLQLVLNTAAPPVERRDTVPFASRPRALGGSLGWVDARVLGALPAASPELASVLALAGPIHDDAGLEGLPERLTTLFVNAHPFRPARHPSSAGDPGRGLVVPRNSIASVGLGRVTDVEWNAGGGAAIAVASGVRRDGPPDLFGLWNGDAAWKGEALTEDPPAFTSWWVGGGTTIPLVADTALVHVAVESGQWQRPFAPLLDDSVATALGDLAGERASPGLAESAWTSASLRLDWSLSNGGALQASLGGATFTDDVPGWPAPDLRYLAARAGLEGTDLVASASLALPLTGPFAMEVRAGGSSSRRFFGGADPTAPSTLLLDPAAALGGAVEEDGEVVRRDAGGTALVHFTRGVHRAKAGVRGSVASFRYDLMDGARATFLFGDASQVGEQGVFVERLGALPPISFATGSGDAFAQYRWTAAPGVTLTVGGRYGLNVFPREAINLDDRWLLQTGMFNNDIPDMTSYVGGIAHGAWDPTGANRTVLEGGLSLEHGETDPAALYEVITNSGLLSVRRAVGDLSSFPGSPITGAPARTSTLTLLDPELAPPRTSRGLLGLAHLMGGGATVRLEASFRHTDLILRRADLNAPLEPALEGEGNRPVLAPLQAWGGVVGPTAAAWRRFTEYDAVWALNGDGWSRYRGLTLSVDRPVGNGGILFATYTFSETTDNLVGLATGDPSATLPTAIRGTDSWEEGRSDLDVPHRLAAGFTLPIPGSVLGQLSAVFRSRSGAPFTPMVRRGLDVNGDGSWMNDVAWIPEGGEAINVATRAGCSSVSGAFPERNSCRGETVRELDLRLTLGPFRIGRAGLEITADLVNATDQEDGVRDDGLLLVDPNGTITVAAGRVSIPYRVNPDFGTLLARSDRGRQLRLGLRVGAPR